MTAVLNKRSSAPQGPYDEHSILRHRPGRRGMGLGCPGSCRRLVRAGDRAPPTFVPSSTPSFTSYGQTASGDYCHASFHRMARSTITFKSGKTPVCGVHLHRVLYEQARRHAGRAACPSVVIMDGQSVKTTERGGARGFDAHKRVKGRKRHILVDTLTGPTGCQPCRTG